LAQPRKLIDRVVAWSPVFFLGGLAALTYWLDAQVQPGRRASTATRATIGPLHRAIRGGFDPEGRLRPSLSARRAQHYRTTAASTSWRRHLH
jgi:hypothetical protein